jgi:hypothetical protein
MRRLLVESSVIRSVGYDRAQQILEIAFHDGHIYQYAGVEPEVVAELLAARSIGHVFRERIRDVYPYRRMTRPRRRWVRRRDPASATFAWRRRASRE